MDFLSARTKKNGVAVVLREVAVSSGSTVE